ncbi:MAG: hypothetical protein NTX50_03170 [Candidatus Sumerlaeota bacterium]|nr:hypothetical protein [Candidatus Sumerlaeota bacterium]
MKRTALFPSRSHSCRGGATLVLVLVIGGVLMMVAASLTRYTVFQTYDRLRYQVYKDEFLACEAGLQKTYAHLQFLIAMGSTDFETEAAACTAPVSPGYSYSNWSVVQTSKDTAKATMNYEINVTAVKTDNPGSWYVHPGVSLKQTLQIKYEALENYAIFYDPDLEIAPGPQMTVTGKVHSNANLYVQSDNSIQFNSFVTAAGSILHGRLPIHYQAGGGGGVTFYNGSAYVSMAGDPAGAAHIDGWFDHLDGSVWNTMLVDPAANRWLGQVKDSAQGAQARKFNMIPIAESPHDIIERADTLNDTISLKEAKFEYQAGLRIVADSAGAIRATNLAPPDPGNSENWNVSSGLTYYWNATTRQRSSTPATGYVRRDICSFSTFKDEREGKTVKSLDIDMGFLADSGIVPSNGILYVVNPDSGSNPGVVRLKNGATIPSNVDAGFTVATNDPIYIWKDYNTGANKKPAMVAGDAVNILSNNWSDSAGSSGYTNATNTETNAVFVNGIVKSDATIQDDTGYSGGVENFFRYQENWSGITHTMTGSIITLYFSEKALGKWGKASVYSPPNRVWSWNTSLSTNGPPGQIRNATITPTQWQVQGYQG